MVQHQTPAQHRGLRQPRLRFVYIIYISIYTYLVKIVKMPHVGNYLDIRLKFTFRYNFNG